VETPPAGVPGQSKSPQGGNDRTVIAARYGGWYAPLVRKPGKECRTGTEVVAVIVQGRRTAPW
jgi:hypothetical protein